MSVFPTYKHPVSWAECCPRNDQSANKIKSTRISRAGSYFKPVLVQIANALLKSRNTLNSRLGIKELRHVVVTRKQL